MKRLFVTSSFGALALGALLLVPIEACTDLTEAPPSQITPGKFFRSEGEVLAALAGVYAQLRGTLDDYYNLSEISTDEMVVPTRGQDWYDNGTWLETHRQQWTATSPGTLSFMNGAWNTAFGGVARANVFLDAVQNTSVPNIASIRAEARVLRAFYYYLLMDMFGGVQLATTSEIKARPRVSRDSLFKFIESELLSARPDLPTTRDAGNNGRITRGAVDAILANMYINAGVFTKDAAGAGGINATAYNSCAGITVAGGLGACQAALNRADSLINSGVYSLATTFSKNFTPDNNTSPEIVFAVKFADAPDMGLNFVMRALHYNQFNPSPWNGFAALAQTYNAFDSTDRRRQIFLVGPQKNVLTGQPVNDRAGNPLVFTITIANVTAATEGEGPRIYKWPADPSHVAQNNGNDYAWFRLAEAYLIKAEAELDGATGSSTPLALVKAMRARSFVTDTLSAVTLPVILRERLFEFTGEGKRRQDLVRFGAYTQAWEWKPGPITDNHVLMPIPQGQIDANPLLTQNPGY
jgi:starch-binding outer membrane protein, SusD/RagB family